MTPFFGFSSSRAKKSSRLSLLSAIFAPQSFRLRPLDDADDEDRARLEIPDEMLERTEAHDRRLNADLMDGEFEPDDLIDLAGDGGDGGDLSSSELAGEALDPALAAGGVLDSDESVWLIAAAGITI